MTSVNQTCNALPDNREATELQKLLSAVQSDLSALRSSVALSTADLAALRSTVITLATGPAQALATSSIAALTVSGLSALNTTA